VKTLNLICVLILALTGCVITDDHRDHLPELDDLHDLEPPTACDALRAATSPAFDVTEIEVDGDVVGEGSTRRCGEPVDEVYPSTWTAYSRRDHVTGQLGFVGRPRHEQWPAGECAWYPAIAVREIGDPSAGTCEAPMHICEDLEAATEPADDVAEVAVEGANLTVYNDQDMYACQHPITDADITWTTQARRPTTFVTNTFAPGAIVVTDTVGLWCRFVPSIATRETFVGACEAGE
jgi:hypothetical protein